MNDMEEASKKSISKELLERGSITLKCASRQELYNQSDRLVESLPEGTNWTRTLCQFNPESLIFEQEIRIVK